MLVFFARHGKDDERYRGGWSMLDLTPEGMEQAKQLAQRLKEEKHMHRISHIIASDLPRAMKTAVQIGEALGLPVQPDSGLREMNNGELAGMLNEEALQQYPGLYFNTLQMDESYPNGESPRAFYERIATWFENLRNHYKDDGNLLVVTHGGVINVIYHIAHDIPWDNKRRGNKVAPCSLHVLNMEKMQMNEI